MTVATGQRKTRSDKKRDIRPTIPIQLYECVSRLSYITNTPMKDIGVTICKKGLYSASVISYLSNYFKRDYWARNNTLYIGDLQNPVYKTTKNVMKKRMTMRFYHSDHEEIASLAFSLDMTVSACTHLLLEAAVKNSDVFNAIITKHVKKELEPKRLKQLREVFKYINEQNPYHDKMSFGMFIGVLLDEVKHKSLTVSDSLKSWLDKHSGN